MFNEWRQVGQCGRRLDTWQKTVPIRRRRTHPVRWVVDRCRPNVAAGAPSTRGWLEGRPAVRAAAAAATTERAAAIALAAVTGETAAARAARAARTVARRAASA